MRLIDAKMVTWDSARWVSLHVTEAVKRIVTRGRRNGGFEVHVRDMEENILDARTVIDPTVCSTVTGKYGLIFIFQIILIANQYIQKCHSSLLFVFDFLFPR